MPLVTDPVSAVAGVVQSIIDKFPDPAQKAAAQQAIAQMYLNGDLQTMTTQAGIITAETNKGGLNAIWRPCLMFCFIGIIANNYILAPYLQAMFHVGLVLQLPPDMWDLLRLGIGGYVMGRSVEKVATTLTGTSPTSAVGAAITNVFKGH
jgi:hypothetical protein